MAISQANKEIKLVFIKGGILGNGQPWWRQLPWVYVRYDPNDDEWGIEPYQDGQFFTDGDGSNGATFVIPQASSERGKIVGFEMIDRLDAGLSELFRVFRISDGSEDAVSAVD